MTQPDGTPSPDDGNQVDACFACPNCGEDHCDLLVWLDDEQVECARCGHVYQPGA